MKTITIRIEPDTYNELLELLECYKNPYISDYWYKPKRIRVLVKDLLEKKVSEELEKAREELSHAPKDY